MHVFTRVNSRFRWNRVSLWVHFSRHFERKASFFWKASSSLRVRHKNHPIVLSKYRVLAIFSGSDLSHPPRVNTLRCCYLRRVAQALLYSSATKILNFMSSMVSNIDIFQGFVLNNFQYPILTLLNHVASTHQMSTI